MNLKSSTGALLSFALLAVAHAMPAQAQEEVREVGTAAFVGIGETVAVEENHQYFAGKFTGAFVATGEPGLFEHAGVMCIGYNDIGAGAGGYCVYTIGSGDRATLTWNCANAAPPAGAILAGDCTATFVSGTGSLAGITGSSRYQALILLPNPDGTLSGLAVYSEGLTYSLP